MAGRSCLCKPHTSSLDSFGSPLGQVGVRRSARASWLARRTQSSSQENGQAPFCSGNARDIHALKARTGAKLWSSISKPTASLIRCGL